MAVLTYLAAMDAERKERGMLHASCEVFLSFCMFYAWNSCLHGRSVVKPPHCTLKAAMKGWVWPTQYPPSPPPPSLPPTQAFTFNRILTEQTTTFCVLSCPVHVCLLVLKFGSYKTKTKNSNYKWNSSPFRDIHTAVKKKTD